MARTAIELDHLADLIADELLRQTTDGGAARADGHACPTGECAADCDGAHCVAHCPDKVRRLVAAGHRVFGTTRREGRAGQIPAGGGEGGGVGGGRGEGLRGRRAPPRRRAPATPR